MGNVDENRARSASGAVMRLAGLLMGLMCLGCDLPRDPEGTLARVRGGILRAGASPALGRVEMIGGKPRGIDVELINHVANKLQARIEWTVGGESELLEALEHYELDVVVGGLQEDSPWKSRVAMSRSYEEPQTGDRRKPRDVVALPPGENRWILFVEEALQAAAGLTPAYGQ
ncbi:MAG: transporter substrate-binding domain-containing protein [Phycisphaerae bacterium]